MDNTKINATVDIDTTEIENTLKKVNELINKIQELKTQTNELNSCIQEIDLNVDVKV